MQERGDAEGERITVGTMHLAKGLEFVAVAVMACDDELISFQERIVSAPEESELNEIFETERHLLYVVRTRARDRLWITGIEPGPEFPVDLTQTSPILRRNGPASSPEAERIGAVASSAQQRPRRRALYPLPVFISMPLATDGSSVFEAVHRALNNFDCAPVSSPCPEATSPPINCLETGGFSGVAGC